MKAIEVNGEWKIENANGNTYGSFETREEAEAAIAEAKHADSASRASPSQY